MRLYKSFLLALCVAIAFDGHTQTSSGSSSVQRKKVAVVLSGGGAKGTAHIGALKVLEQAGIPIDMIVGTSMGALMGGLYCIGYDSHMLDSLVRIQDWPFLLSDRIDPMDQDIVNRNKQNTYMLSLSVNDGKGKISMAQPGFIKGKNLANLFSRLTLGYHDSIDFNLLPIPFACVATDMVKFNEIVFLSGNLATAMRASMSIPAVFSPVQLDTMVLVDGGLRNNFPVDVAKAMGADIVIGVTVQNIKEKTPDYFNSTGAVINQLMDVNTENKLLDNLLMTDIFIRVNVDGYSAASFNSDAIDTLINRGERAAMQQWDALMDLKKELSLSDSGNADGQRVVRKYRMIHPQTKLKVSQTEFKNIASADKKYLQEKFNLHKGGVTTVEGVEKAVTALRSNLFYQDASYQIHYQKDGYKISLESEGKKAAQLFMGVRFDNEEKVSLQFCGLMPLRIVVPTVLQGTVRLGKRSMGKLEATLNPSSFVPVSLAYTYRHQDINVYYHASKDFNPDYNQHQVELGILNYGYKNLLVDFFARWDYYDYKQILMGQRSRNPVKNVSHLFSYNARVHFDNRSNPYFAVQGDKYEIKYGMYTDNLYQYKNSSPVHVLSFNSMKIIPLNR
ncbi:MAG: patatin-like phospholipase family protein, partial [Bacteroidales bacterium]|nr:patatin-like phospholipase family protein [Bacteroidales bacterium]